MTLESLMEQSTGAPSGSMRMMVWSPRRAIDRLRRMVVAQAITAEEGDLSFEDATKKSTRRP